MKAWVTHLQGEYFETEDNVSISDTTATQVLPRPSQEAAEEQKIQKEMRKILRKMAIDALKQPPTP